MLELVLESTLLSELVTTGSEWEVPDKTLTWARDMAARATEACRPTTRLIFYSESFEESDGTGVVSASRYAARG